MDGWVPDLGLTGYANYSIYRPPSVAAAGITTTVRHRFRVPPRNPKLPGPYYLAALIYDKAGEEFPLELSLGSEDVGRIEPRRHDNRRHLIVIDRPILFDDRVKWIQFASDGRGECRIERFVLLAEAPEPSSFAPAIERLHVEVDASGDAAASTVHCLTFPPSRVAVSVQDDNRGDGRGVRPGRPVDPARDRASRRAARPHLDRPTDSDRAGRSRPRSRSASSARRRPEPRCPRAPMSPGRGRGRAVRHRRHLGPGRAAAHLRRAGLAAARSSSAGDARLVWGASAGDASAAQARIHSRWPDGSARWVLVDTTVPPPLQPGGRADCRVLLSAAEAPNSGRSAQR